MATDLASIKARVSALLVDASNVNFPTAQLEESIRLALGEYNLMLGLQGVTAVTLKDLDGAAATTLPAGHESMMVVGAAAYAVAGRTVGRAENYDLNQNLPQQLFDWAHERLADFRRMVSSYRADLNRDSETTRKSGLHNAATPPYTSTDDQASSWPVDEHDGEEL